MPDGSMLSIPVNVLVGLSHRPVLLAVAGHHGDEHEGPAALVEVWRQLDPDDLRGSLIAIPVLNPPAFRVCRRTGDDDHVDMNRIFPGNPEGTVTHQVAHAFIDQVLVQADLILSMHGWSAGYLVEPYVEFPCSGEVMRASWEAARAFGLRYLNPLDARPGTLMAEAVRRSLPLIEVEIGGQGTSVPQRRRLYENGIHRLLGHLGMLGSDPGSEAGVAYVDRRECLAPVGGLTRPEVTVGEQVAAGQPMVTVYDLNLRPLAEVRAPCSGTVGVLRLAASTLPGQLVATVFPPADWTPPDRWTRGEGT
jgi:predicted deacylase